MRKNIVRQTPKSLNHLLKKRPPLAPLNQIHGIIVTNGNTLSCNHSLTTSLILSYLHIENLITARSLFNRYPLPSPPLLLWNIMIRVYSKLQFSPEPINLFRQMVSFYHPSTRVIADDYTYTFLVTSCSHQESAVNGDVIHGLVRRNGYSSNLYVENALINMYSVFGKMDDASKVFGEITVRDVFSWTSLVCGYVRNKEMRRACEVFWEMPMRNDVSWAVMISGYVGDGRYIAALKFFREMLDSDDNKLIPNEAILVCTLSACAHLGALDQGKWIHVYIDRNNIFASSNISTALIDMYAKCGDIDCARRVFDRICRPDIHNFTSLITGFSVHGLGREALCLFNQMLAENAMPNEVTVLSVLYGCSHSGLVDEGSTIFTGMEKDWGIEPKIEHYGCYVDLLGRAGYLEKAFKVVKCMPIKPDTVIWRSLLNACRIHRNVELGEQIMNHVKQVGTYGHNQGEVLLSNLYASVGKWESAADFRMLMDKRKTQSDIGCSWVEVYGVTHEFRATDQLHAQIFEIREKLQEILVRASQVGYNASTTHVSFDLSDEDKVQAVAWHSEKLAVAFAIMTAMPGTCIRIVKNLRTCDDCHSALKAISKAYERELIVRDRSRFHTFKEGNCSCKDYW